MNIDQTILRIRDRRRYFKCAVASVIASASLVAVHLFGYIWLNGKIEANPNRFVPTAWITVASLRTMAIVWGMILGGSIGWLINEVRHCTLRDVVVHLLERVNELESQIAEFKQDDSEQPDGAVTQESAPSAAP